MKPVDPPRWRRQGFTLLEALLAIVILTVLIAILYPAFQKASQASKTAKCQANLRYLGSVFALHLADAGFYPPCRKVVEWSNDPQGPPWMEYLDKYLKWGKWGEHPIRKCPTSKFNYGINAAFSNFIKPAEVKLPAKVALLFETDGQYRIKSSDLQQITFPHNDLTMVLFADGHVEKRTLQSIPPWNRRYKPEWYAFWYPSNGEN